MFDFVCVLKYVCIPRGYVLPNGQSTFVIFSPRNIPYVKTTLKTMIVHFGNGSQLDTYETTFFIFKLVTFYYPKEFYLPNIGLLSSKASICETFLSHLK